MLTKLFSGSTGLNNKVDPVRLRFDPETGIQDLALAVNVDIDDTGRVGRRKGYTRQISGSYHSLFSCGIYALAASGGNLVVINRDYTTSNIATITPNAPVSYVRASDMQQDVVYWMNDYEKGKVSDKTNSSWTVGSYVGPDRVKQISGPPIGHLLELWHGIMFIAKDNIVWHSERFAYSNYDLARGFLPFESRIRMLKAVSTGLFVSTEDEVFYLAGTSAHDLGRLKVADYPAVEGTVVDVPLSRIGNGEMTGRGLLWATTEGVCLGGPEGYFTNLTSRKLDLPSAIYGGGLYKDGKYVFTFEP